MTTKYGDFVPPKFNCVGDKFIDHEGPGDRDRGLAFKAPVSKSGKVILLRVFIPEMAHIIVPKRPVVSQQGKQMTIHC
jgi:hypothetical protein